MVKFRKSNNYLTVPVYLAIWLIVGSCANIGAPTGGPRDTTPPVLLYSEPPNSSANFSSNQIRIFFDEFIQLRGLSQKLFISPPLEKTPEIRVRGKSLVINLRENLRENTTYSFFFGDAIVDFTEGNAITSFTFVVATGAYVDSLSLSGNVAEAFSMKPVDGALVMLYDNFVDSVPYLEFPSYVALTDKSGNYTINNIREGEFKIFALKDKNANYKFDLPDEAIGFLDSLVTPSYAGTEASKNIENVTEEPKNEQNGEEPTERPKEEPDYEIKPLIDITTAQTEIKSIPKYNLLLFVEADTVQRITAEPIGNGVVRFLFRQPFSSLDFRDLSGKLPEKWKYTESSSKNDTLNLYLIPPVADSIYVEIADKGQVIDSIRVATRPRVARTREASRTSEASLQLQPNINRARNLHYFENLRISSASLIDAFENDLFRMMSIEDSLYFDTTFEIDSLMPRHLVLKTPLEQGKKYQLQMPEGAITSIFGLPNDSLVVNFSTTQPEDYSSLVVNLNVEDALESYILQLLDKDGKILNEKFTKGAGFYSFNNLMAGNYGLRLIDDINGNQKWDTGNYLKKIKPEQVYLFDEQITIRQNWEAEMSWVVNK
jgi:uncharacterized protein (DUF2141 family)